MRLNSEVSRRKEKRNNKRWPEGRRKCGAATGDSGKTAKSRKKSDVKFRNDRTINIEVRNKMEMKI